MSMDIMQAALSYTKANGHRHAMAIFPVNQKKKTPCTKNGLYDASSDCDTVRAMWEQYPNANIGLPTGKKNGVLVVDFDNKPDEGIFAEESIRVLEERFGELPDSWQAITGGGGYHYFFQYPSDREVKNSVGQLAPGVDVRGEGGYVVAAPSVHASGRNYEWELAHVPCDIPLAPLSEAWLNAITKAHTCAIDWNSEPEDAYKQPFELPDVITTGCRNDTLFRYACSLRARRVRASDILKALTEANEDKCAEPLKSSEITTLFDRAMNYNPGNGKTADPTLPDATAQGISFKPFDYSEIGTAAVFETVNENCLQWTPAMGWLVWNGSHWEQNEQRARNYARVHTDMVLDEARRQFSEAQTVEGGKVVIPEDAKQYLKYAERMRSARSIDAILSVAKADLYMDSNQFDANPWDLNTPGGIVDLRTGDIRPNDPLAYCTKITAVEPTKAGGKLWHDFLNLVTEGDDDMKRYLQCAAGMCAVGTVFHEGIILAYAGGANGKSTFFNSLALAMGEYATSIDVTVLTTDKQNRGASLATLRGARLVTCGELEEGQRLSVQTLKRVASTDAMTIEEKYRQPETIIPSHHICLFTNHLPKVGSTDAGTWRRLTVIPFTATMPTGSKRIPNYAKHLFDEEGGAILQWIIDGAVMFHKNGDRLIEIDAIRQATEAYRTREDWLRNFIKDCCIEERGATVRCGALFDAYKEYALENGDYKRRKADFNAAMETAGFHQDSVGQNKMVWRGLKLNPEVTYGETKQPFFSRPPAERA